VGRTEACPWRSYASLGRLAVGPWSPYASPGRVEVGPWSPYASPGSQEISPRCPCASRGCWAKAHGAHALHQGARRSAHSAHALHRGARRSAHGAHAAARTSEAPCAGHLPASPRPGQRAPVGRRTVAARPSEATPPGTPRPSRRGAGAAIRRLLRRCPPYAASKSKLCGYVGARASALDSGSVGRHRCSRIFFTAPGSVMVAVARILAVHLGQRSAHGHRAEVRRAGPCGRCGHRACRRRRREPAMCSAS